MDRNSALIFILLLGLVMPASTYAQLTPPVGSAGAGNAPISGVPFGPANPRALSDPSGIGNAARIPPPGTNSPPPPVNYGPLVSSPSRAITPPYAGASQRIFIPDRRKSKKPPGRRRGRPQPRTYTGICTGC